MCEISVVTSIYNGEKYIGETIESIIHQTFTDWEYIIIDNASTDASAEIIESYAKRDSRIRFYRNRENIGISANLNQCLDLASGKYIARTDADDLSYPERLQKQFQYMKEHPEVSLLGCRADIWNNGVSSRPRKKEFMNYNCNETRFALPFVDFIPASSFFVRKEVLDKFCIRYRPYIYAEDFAYLLDILKHGEIISLAEPLIVYRVYETQVTQTVAPEIPHNERINIQCLFLDQFPKEYRDIFHLAFLGEIHAREDMRKFAEGLLAYANVCGMGNDTEKLAKCQSFRDVYRYIYYWQTGNMRLLYEYMNSPFREPFWYLQRKGISLIKQCLLRKAY